MEIPIDVDVLNKHQPAPKKISPIPTSVTPGILSNQDRILERNALTTWFGLTLAVSLLFAVSFLLNGGIVSLVMVVFCAFLSGAFFERAGASMLSYTWVPTRNQSDTTAG